MFSAMSPSEKADHRKKVKCAVSMFRERLKDTMDMMDSSTTLMYKSSATFGKAKRKAMKGLPQSPRKRAAVMKSLAAEVLDVFVPGKQTSIPRPGAISADVKALVEAYYENDALSKMMPCKADTITLCSEDGEKRHIQKRHLPMTVAELFQQFQLDHPDTKVVKSSFAALRSQWVLLSSEMPHNVCGCKYHQNIILLLESLHKKCHDVIPNYSNRIYV